MTTLSGIAFAGLATTVALFTLERMAFLQLWPRWTRLTCVLPGMHIGAEAKTIPPGVHTNDEVTLIQDEHGLRGRGSGHTGVLFTLVTDAPGTGWRCRWGPFGFFVPCLVSAAIPVAIVTGDKLPVALLFPAAAVLGMVLVRRQALTSVQRGLEALLGEM